MDRARYRPRRGAGANCLRIRGQCGARQVIWRDADLEFLHLHHPMPTSGRLPHRPLTFFRELFPHDFFRTDYLKRAARLLGWR